MLNISSLDTKKGGYGGRSIPTPSAPQPAYFVAEIKKKGTIYRLTGY